MKKGIFISFEGGDSCGKSTQIKLLKDYLIKTQKINNFLFVREPGGTPLSEEIRKLLLDYQVDPPLDMTELLLFCAARVENAEKNIKPALQQGKIVVADRFYDSTIAYQGSARKIMSPEKILTLTKDIIGELKPDLTFFFKLDPKIAFERKGATLDRIEKEGLDFQQKVQDGYDYIAKIEKERFCIIDSTLSVEEIFEQIKNELKKRFPKEFN